jgi:peptide/nickel transport system ATP-binding protein
MPEADVLTVEDLRVEYLRPGGDLCVVDGVSFAIRPGEVFGLAGESGSGKSTIALSLVRLLRPPGVITGGRVLCEGQDVLAMSEVALRAFRWRRVALVTQEAMNALNPLLTVGEQLADPILAHERTSQRAARDRAALLLDLVGVQRDRLSSYPHELSGGMRQRVVIAMALALRPALIIMDEPTTALDVVVQNEILAHIGALREKLGFSVLFIGHDLSLMLGFCSRVGVLYAGRLVETAPVAVLAAGPRHPYTQGLMSCLLHPRGQRTGLTGIAGQAPDPAHPPGGCHFHPRCPSVMDRCRTDRPALVRLGGDHQGACHLCP